MEAEGTSKGGAHFQYVLRRNPVPEGALPEGWEEVQYSDGRLYYHCVETGTTQWERPPMPLQPLGFEFTPEEGALSVVAVTGSLAAEKNASLGRFDEVKEHALRIGDCIHIVNGAKDYNAIMEQLQSAMHVHMAVVRPSPLRPRRNVLVRVWLGVSGKLVYEESFQPGAETAAGLRRRVQEKDVQEAWTAQLIRSSTPLEESEDITAGAVQDSVDIHFVMQVLSRDRPTVVRVLQQGGLVVCAETYNSTCEGQLGYLDAAKGDRFHASAGTLQHAQPNNQFGEYVYCIRADGQGQGWMPREVLAVCDPYAPPGAPGG